MSTKIESLELEIVSNLKDATKGIDALTRSLTKLKGVTVGKLGLSAVVDEIALFNKADVNGVKSKSDTLAKAVSSLANLPKSNLSGYITPLKNLPKALAGMDNVDLSDFNAGLTEVVTALKPLSDLSKSNLSGYLTSLKKIPETMGELNKVDMGAFATKMREVATAMKPLASEMEKISNGFSAMPTKIQKLIQATDKIPSTNKKAEVSFTDLYNKIRLGANVVKQFTTKIWSAVEKSMDYTENMNLFTVSMGEYASEAYAYAEKVSDAMGIDTSEWIRAQGVFMTLATGFGVAGDRAYTMSQNLTQLSYDLASFYNMDVEDALLKVKSGLAGELEPLRAIGYDLSQAKLEATALELGITKSVSAMTQAEKAQLRYYAIMTQVTNTHGDMARTLEDPANQMRVFRAQVNMAAREIGNMFIPALNAIIPYATAVVKVVGAAASIIAGLFGYEKKDVEDSTSKVAESTNAVTENLSDAQDEAKKLKSYMLGFDELNVINPNSGEDVDTSGEFEFELPEYDFLEGLAESRVATIVEDMKEWLGITEDINTWADLFDTKLGGILTTVGLIAAGFAGWKLGEGLIAGIELVKAVIASISSAWAEISAVMAGISASSVIVVAIIVAVIAGLTAVYLTNEKIRESVNNAVEDIGTALVPLLTFIKDTVIPGLKTAWDELLKILKPLGDWIAMIFVSTWEDMLIPALEWIAETLIPSVTTVFIDLWNNVLVPLAGFLGSVLTPVINILVEVLTWLWQYVVLPITDLIGGVFSEVWVNLVKIITETVNPGINRLISIFQFLWTNVLLPIVQFLWDVLSPGFEEVFKGIGDIIASLKLIFVGLINFVTGVFTGDWKQAWEGIKSILKGTFDSFFTVLKTPLNVALAQIEAFINKIIDGWNWVKTQINSLSIDLPDWLGGGHLGFDLKMSSHVTIPRFADGGFPETGQMFIAREAGAEMVGNIGRRTAVANNDQIVAGIAGGVAEANEEQNVLLREQNSLLRAILEKESGVYLDGKNLTASVEKYQRERGRVLISGGVL